MVICVYPCLSVVKAVSRKPLAPSPHPQTHFHHPADPLPAAFSLEFVAWGVPQRAMFREPVLLGHDIPPVLNAHIEYWRNRCKDGSRPKIVSREMLIPWCSTDTPPGEPAFKPEDPGRPKPRRSTRKPSANTWPACNYAWIFTSRCSRPDSPSYKPTRPAKPKSRKNPNLPLNLNLHLNPHLNLHLNPHLNLHLPHPQARSPGQPANQAAVDSHTGGAFGQRVAQGLGGVAAGPAQAQSRGRRCADAA